MQDEPRRISASRPPIPAWSSLPAVSGPPADSSWVQSLHICRFWDISWPPISCVYLHGPHPSLCKDLHIRGTACPSQVGYPRGNECF